MANKILYAILPVLAVVLIAGCLGQSQPAVQNNQNTQQAQPAPQQPPSQEQTPPQQTQGTGETQQGATIEYTATGFVPNQVTIKKGQSVTWVNKNTVDMWPASAQHPTHTVYPGSSITKCGTAEEKTIFDACKNIAPGGTYTFTFDNVGSWAFHDHISSKFFGKVTVT